MQVEMDFLIFIVSCLEYMPFYYGLMVPMLYLFLCQMVFMEYVQENCLSGILVIMVIFHAIFFTQKKCQNFIIDRLREKKEKRFLFYIFFKYI